VAGVKVRALERAIPQKWTCLLDSSFVLTYLHGHEPASEVAAHVVDNWVAHGRNIAIVSVITAMEASVRPIRSNNQPALQMVMDFMRSFPNLRLVPVDANCAFEAARVRAVASLPAPDALIVAAGLLNRVQVILTNDRAWKSRMHRVTAKTSAIYLEDFV